MPRRPPHHGRSRAFVVVAPGLEALALDELRALGVTGRAGVTRGGIEIDLTTRQLYLAHRRCRVPTRVLVRVAEAEVHRFDGLAAVIGGIEWERFVGAGSAVDVRVASQASQLYHEGAIAERVVAALDRPVDPSGQRIHVRLDRNRLTVSVDATGASLHRRGWRSAAHAAPLRATLAAAMLRAAGHEGTVPVVDPMTGSGTIAIEAAAIALGLPIERDFAFRHWPAFEPGTWASAAADRSGDRRGVDGAIAPIVAADRDAGAVAMAAEHAHAAGVGDVIDIQHAALDAQRWPDRPSLVVCNPPYGHRLGDADRLRDLYAALGRRVRDGGHQLCVLTPDDRAVRATGLDLEERFATTHGGIHVRCWLSPGRSGAVGA